MNITLRKQNAVSTAIRLTPNDRQTIDNLVANSNSCKNRSQFIRQAIAEKIERSSANANNSNVQINSEEG